MHFEHDKLTEKDSNQFLAAPVGSADGAGSAGPFKKLCAEMLKGRDRHKLTDKGRGLVRVLESEGYLTTSKDGFVGCIPPLVAGSAPCPTCNGLGKAPLLNIYGGPSAVITTCPDCKPLPVQILEQNDPALAVPCEKSNPNPDQ